MNFKRNCVMQRLSLSRLPEPKSNTGQFCSAARCEAQGLSQLSKHTAFLKGLLEPFCWAPPYYHDATPCQDWSKTCKLCHFPTASCATCVSFRTGPSCEPTRSKVVRWRGQAQHSKCNACEKFRGYARQCSSASDKALVKQAYKEHVAIMMRDRARF